MNEEIMTAGLDTTPEKKQEEKIVTIEEAKKKRAPFAYWTVNGVDHKCKLTTGMIEKLESKYKTSVINLVSADGIPPLSVMLTIVQAAMSPWEHGTTIDKIEKLYESWVDQEDGNQMDLYTDVIMPICAVSGFFTPAQADTIMAALKKATTDTTIL